MPEDRIRAVSDGLRQIKPHHGLATKTLRSTSQGFSGKVRFDYALEEIPKLLFRWLAALIAVGAENNKKRGVFVEQVKAVIKRFDGTHAVLLIDDGKKSLVVPRESLPEEARKGHWLQIKLEGDKVTEAVIDQEAGAEAKQRVNDIMERLMRGGQ